MIVTKQSAGEAAAIVGTGASPCLPYNACCKSLCPILVGNPVEAPARCTSKTTNGNSVTTAKPKLSLFKSIPGPEVQVNAKQPPKLAPKQAPIAEISSSA